jgi:serine O-acetyltransferase
MVTLEQTFNDIKNDLPSKSLKSFLNHYFFSAGFRVLLNHRIGKYCYHSRFMLVRQIANYYRIRLITKRNCDISYKALIGKNVRFPHPIGIVIGEGVVIKDNVKIWQQVTLGSHGKQGDEMSYPVIENNVKIFAGAKIFGSINLGENSTIGANAVVNINVAADCVAVGVPYKTKYE